MQTIILLIGVCCCSQVRGQPKWKDCSDRTGVVTTFTIKECPREPCVLAAGHKITGRIEFVSTRSHKDVVIWMSIPIVFGLRKWIKLPYPYSDGCRYATPHCPIQRGLKYTVEVQAIVPKVKYNGSAQLSLYDSKNYKIVCVDLRLIIQ
ncbi:hypothetical protein T265_05038 [Opisthorchis viverrini]|uniref:MD-2-related lipid-recognition domain-containing protein n=1 Tax=Opisthorchis viverrini TaxID=6198 RepID=A0A074ZXI5_OPIVI|nr:hypothetical protein T265_05038 [Opisthorchis viverrini]KER28060.1 hypothetical protein T265_05038 [Opisthorchis viverrini]